MIARIGHNAVARRRNYIKAWREHRALSQKQLADRLDTTSATISRIESGARDYTGDFLNACADALSCEAQDLISRHPSVQSLDAKVRGASDNLRQQVYTVVDLILKSAS